MRSNLSGQLIRAAIVILGLSYAFWGTDIDKLWQAISGYGLGFIILGVIGTGIALWPVVIRFRYLLHNEISFRDAFNVILLGIGLNNILPAKAGEFAKIAYLKHISAKSMAYGANLVFWERFFDIQAMLSLGLISSLYVDRELAILPLTAISIVGWTAVIGIQFRPTWGFALANFLPITRVRAFATEALEQFALRVRPSFIAGLAFYTMLTWGAYFFYYYLVLNVGAGFNLTWQQVIIVIAVTSIGLAVPASPAGLGLLEAALVLSLSWFGIAKSDAVAAAVIIRLTQYLPMTLGSLLILTRTGISLRQLVSLKNMPQPDA